MALALEGRRMKRIRLHPDFADIIAQHGIGMNEMADLSGIARATLYALQNPETHPHRAGGMRRTTAWKIINAFVARTGIPPQAAKEMLMVEEDEPGRQRNKTDATDEAAQ